MQFRRKLWGVSLLGGNKLTFTKWVTGEGTNKLSYSYTCLSHCFPSIGLCPDTWRAGEQDVFWRHAFSSAAPDAAACAEGSALSWVELPTSSSHSPFTTGLNPGSPACPATAGQCLLPRQMVLRTVNRRDGCLERPGQQKWWSFSCAWVCSAALLNEKQNAEGSYISCGPAVTPLGCWKQVAQDALWKGGTGCVSWLGFTGMTRM